MLTNFARLSRRIVALVALERFISSVIMLVSFQIKNLSAWKITMITLERLFFGMGHQLMWLNRVVRQNANRTKCQPDKMPTGLFLWLAFRPSQLLVSILSGTSQHVLTLCPNHQVGLMSFDDKSYMPVYKWSRFFWRTKGCTNRGTGCLKKLSFTDLSISRLDWPLRAACPWKLTFLLVISY